MVLQLVRLSHDTILVIDLGAFKRLLALKLQAGINNLITDRRRSPSISATGGLPVPVAPKLVTVYSLRYISGGCY